MVVATYPTVFQIFVITNPNFGFSIIYWTLATGFQKIRKRKQVFFLVLYFIFIAEIDLIINDLASIVTHIHM